MNNFDKNIADVFDMNPFPNDPGINDTNTNKKTVLSVKYNEPDLKQDLTDAYQQSRENLQGLIDQGQEAMQEILNIAKAGQHPRAFEVYGTLLKNVVDANKELLAIQKQMREMDEEKKKSSGTQIDKAIFVGSTAELNKLIKGKE
jgi:hypothetical protein